MLGIIWRAKSTVKKANLEKENKMSTPCVFLNEKDKTMYESQITIYKNMNQLTDEQIMYIQEAL